MHIVYKASFNTPEHDIFESRMVVNIKPVVWDVTECTRYRALQM
jgi:hypothetical protein